MDEEFYQAKMAAKRRVEYLLNKFPLEGVFVGHTVKQYTVLFPSFCNYRNGAPPTLFVSFHVETVEGFKSLTRDREGRGEVPEFTEDFKMLMEAIKEDYGITLRLASAYEGVSAI